MNVENISNRKYLAQVKNTIKVVENESSVKLLRIDTVLSSNISKINQFKITIGDSVFSIEVKPQLVSDSNYMVIFEIPDSSDPLYNTFINSNKLSIFVVDKYNNILDSQINRKIDSNDESVSISNLISSAGSVSFAESIFLETTRLINDIRLDFNRSPDGNPRIRVVTSTPVNRVSVIYKDTSLSLTNNIYEFDFSQESLQFIEKIQSDLESQESNFIFNIRLNVNSRTLNIEKEVNRNTLIDYISHFYNAYRLSDIVKEIQINVQEYYNEGKSIEFILDGIQNQDINKIFINDILSDSSSINIYANKLLNEDNKIIYKDKSLSSLIDNENKINVFTENNIEISSLELYYVNRNNSFIKTSGRGLNISRYDFDFIFSNVFIDNYRNDLTKIRFLYDRSNTNINRGVNSIFRFNNITFSNQDQLTWLTNTFNYVSDEDPNQLSYSKLVKKGLYSLELQIKFNSILIDNKKFLQTYEELFENNNSLNNKINQLSFENIISNPRHSIRFDEINDIFSSNKSISERLDLINQFNDFNISLNISIKPFFDYSITNKYRFLGYDEDIYLSNQVYVIPVSSDANSDHEEANRSLNRFISYLRNNSQNTQILNDLIGSYLKNNLIESEKLLLIDNLTEYVFNNIDNLSETFVINKSFIISSLSRQQGNININTRSIIDSYNLNLVKSGKSSVTVKKSSNLISNPNGNRVYEKISTSNSFSNQNFLSIQTINNHNDNFYIKCRYYFDIESNSYSDLDENKYEKYKNKIIFSKSYMNNHMQHFSEYYGSFINSNIINIDNTTKIILFSMNDFFLFNSQKLKDLLKVSFISNQSSSISLESIILNVELYNSNNMLIDILDTKIYIDEPVIINNSNVDLVEFNI
jgi:hypothetical protein